MIWKRIVTLIAAIALVSLSACHLQALGPPSGDVIGTAIGQTEAVQTSFANALAGTLTAMVPAAPTLTPTSPFTPTITDTPTPTFTLTLAAPMVSVSMDTNCRTGPGNVYDNIGGLKIGETAAVVGRDAYNQYWIIKNPDNLGTCWLWGQYATVTGDTSKLPVIAPPPTPTPVPAVIKVTISAISEVHMPNDCIVSPPFLHNFYHITITTNGPTMVRFSVNEEGKPLSPIIELNFTAAGTQSSDKWGHENPSNYLCGTHIVSIDVTYPNKISAQTTYTVYYP